MKILVQLVDKSPSTVWENSTLSFFNDVAYIASTDLLKVQTAAKKLRATGFNEVVLGDGFASAELCWAFYQGFFTAKKNFTLEYPELAAEDQNKLTAWIDCSTFMRDLINAPADDLPPEQLVTQAANFLLDQANLVGKEEFITTKVILGSDLLEHKYFGTYTVGKSSTVHPAAALEVDYNPTGKEDAPTFIALVGKGITFDSGGYSLKPSSSMVNMRTDMGGSALVTAALGLAIRQNLTKRIKLFICSAENMVSDTAVKLGDIITYANGTTVEVLNTDAEGRLVLADGLIKASAFKPEYLIDCATLTGAAKVALGNDYHAVLSHDDAAVQKFLSGANANHEAFWRLPLMQLHTDVMTSNYADMSNIAASAAGGVGAGASTAAGFLAKFVANKQGWLHFDCSATFRAGGAPQWGVGATGIGMRSIADFLGK